MTVRSVGPVHFNSGGKGSEVALFGAFHVMHVNRMTLDAPTKNANVEGQFRAPGRGPVVTRPCAGSIWWSWNSGGGRKGEFGRIGWAG